MKILQLCSLLCLISLTGLSQNKNTFSLTLDHLALSVKDVNKSADFYGNVLKLEEITNKTKLEGIRWFSLGQGKELHLISIVKENVVANKAIHLALTTPDFDALVKILEKQNVAYCDWPGTYNKINIRADGIKQIFFQDPDGYWVEVNSVAEK